MNKETDTVNKMTDDELAARIEKVIKQSEDIGKRVACRGNNHYGFRVIPSRPDDFSIPDGCYTEENVPTGPSVGGFPTFTRGSLEGVIEWDQEMDDEISRRVLPVLKQV